MHSTIPFSVFAAMIIIVMTFPAAGCSQQTAKPQTTMSPAELATLAAKMEDQGGEHIHLPPLPTNYSTDRYYNTKPSDLTKAALAGKVVLIDIWDYTCVNCIRTLPYIKSWAEKYKDKGLIVIGIHSPEFDFERMPENLKAQSRNSSWTIPSSPIMNTKFGICL